MKKVNNKIIYPKIPVVIQLTYKITYKITKKQIYNVKDIHRVTVSSNIYD